MTSVCTRLRDLGLTHIKGRPLRLGIVLNERCLVPASARKDPSIMSNVGSVDRIVRIVAGLLLIAFAVPIGFPQIGWNWVGWIGVVPLLTAVFAYCPAYTLFGLSTCPAKPQG